MRAIQYAAPESIADAVALLAQYGPSARMLAGGTDLIPQVNEDIRDAELFVDAKRIPELTALDYDQSTGLTLGAATPCYRIYNDLAISEAYPALTDSAMIIGSTGIQGRASIGGNLCNSGPAADSIPSLIALSAVARIAGPNGERTVPVEDFCTSPGKNVMQPGEMLVSLQLPPSMRGSSSAYIRFIPRNEMDIAEVGVGVWVALNDDKTVASCRIALAAVAPRPLYVRDAGHSLVGKTPDEEAIAEAARIAQAACSPITDMRGTAEHRRRLVGVLVKRTLQKALDRSGNAR